MAATANRRRIVRRLSSTTPDEAGEIIIAEAGPRSSPDIADGVVRRLRDLDVLAADATTAQAEPTARSARRSAPDGGCGPVRLGSVVGAGEVASW